MATLSKLDAIIAALRAHKNDLQDAGVVGLSLFGSAARGEARDDSDVDIAVELDPDAHVTLVRLSALERRLSEILGRSVSSNYSRAACLADILDNIERINRYGRGLHANELEKDDVKRDAIERCLERICEAAVRLGDAAAELRHALSSHRFRRDLGDDPA